MVVFEIGTKHRRVLCLGIVCILCGKTLDNTEQQQTHTVIGFHNKYNAYKKTPLVTNTSSSRMAPEKQRCIQKYRLGVAQNY